MPLTKKIPIKLVFRTYSVIGVLVSHLRTKMPRKDLRWVREPLYIKRVRKYSERAVGMRLLSYVLLETYSEGEGLEDETLKAFLAIIPCAS